MREQSAGTKLRRQRADLTRSKERCTQAERKLTGLLMGVESLFKQMCVACGSLAGDDSIRPHLTHWISELEEIRRRGLL